MKKLFIMLLLLIISISFISCDGMINNSYVDGWFIGVATDMSSDGEDERIVLNIPTIGYTEIPEYEHHIDTFFDDEQHEDYQIKEGDLVYIWYERASDVSILESYPARFGTSPDSIHVYDQNLSLEQTENDWLIQIPLEIEVFNAINDYEENTIYVWYEGSVDNEIKNILLCETELISLSESSLKLLIDNEYIMKFLEEYINDELIFTESNIES